MSVGVEARDRRLARLVRRVERDPAAAGWDADAWWARIPAVRTVLDTGLDLPAGVTFLVGENGSGKSTLIEALAQAYGLNPEGGSRGAMHRSRPTESPLGSVLRLVRTPGGRGDAYFLRAETTHGLYTYPPGRRQRYCWSWARRRTAAATSGGRSSTSSMVRPGRRKSNSSTVRVVAE